MVTFFSTELHIGRCTQTMHCTVESCLFGIIIVICIAFLRQSWDPIGADITLFVDRDIFLQFSRILQPACLGTHPSLRGIAHRPSGARRRRLL